MLRERWAGALPWNKKSEQGTITTTNNSRSSSIITSPTGLFIRPDGIVNEKKPALAEASISSPLQDDLTPLPEKRDKERDVWANTTSPTTTTTTSRKQHQSKGHHQQARPVSDQGFLGFHPKYPAMTMPRDTLPPPPPINRIHDYLQQRPGTYNPSPLHFRAIAMAANLFESGAITPAKLYAQRTQTMIAKWTMGLIMNSKPSKPSQGSFPIIRESTSSEQNESLGQDGTENGSGHHYHKRDGSGLEMMSSHERRSGTLSPTELPRALSYKGHSTAPSFASSPHSSSAVNIYPGQYLTATTQNVVELSDIS
ncbi:hypothetical protein BGZ65_008061, partial [Modicella reniformis]